MGKRMDHKPEKLHVLFVRDIPENEYRSLIRLKTKFEADDWRELFRILCKENGVYQEAPPATAEM